MCPVCWDNSIQVSIFRPVVHNAGSQAKLPFQLGIGQINPPPPDNTFQHGEVETIASFLRSVRPETMTEADGTQFHWSNELQFWRASNCSSQMLRLLEILPDGLSKRRQPMVTERQPELQRAKTPRELHRLFEEGKAFNGIRIELPGIGAGIGECLARDRRIPVQEATTIKRLVEPFVRIQRQGIGMFKSLKLLRSRNGGECPVSTIHVELGLVGMRNRCDLG